LEAFVRPAISKQLSPRWLRPRRAIQKTKKADVAEHPEVFNHVGLLVNEPSSYAGMLFV
jgi:hypothetical protein